jgi:enoyl-CoA hydratase/carnithine racemase
VITVSNFGQGIGRIALARPEARNAISISMWRELTAAVDRLANDSLVRVILLASDTEGVFCPGADIKEFPALAVDPDRRLEIQGAMQACCNQIEALAKPTIALIDGACVGAGCSIALACDLRLASRSSTFGITPAKLGLVYGLADTRRLEIAVGRAAAKRMLFTAALFSADEARAIGLIDAVCEPGSLSEEGLRIAAAIAENSAVSHGATKQAFRDIDAGSRVDDVTWQAAFRDAFVSDDASARIAAFLGRGTAKLGKDGHHERGFAGV